MYPHSATRLAPTESPYKNKSSHPAHDRIRTARNTPLSPPSPNSHSPYLRYIHPTQFHSRTNSILQSTQPDPRPHPQPSIHYTTPDTPKHLPTRPTSTPQPIYPTIATPHIIVPSKPSPLLPLYAHPPQRESSVLARRTCHKGGFAVTIEY